MGFDLIYPKHKHSHGLDTVSPNKYRLWVCDECGHIFNDEEIRKDKSDNPNEWGHICKSHPCAKYKRCESHLESYMPECSFANEDTD